ncbi:MAG: GNAT family N-acetyltransferase, partial [Gammaproteobacteria bacterium]|nr:GNAT family N-acetyltransferase [Gammaproteobacteria bacterium]
MTRFPSRLVTKRLILRPPTPDDAAGVLAAVTASYPELHRWMPWAKDPYGIEQARAFCADSQTKLKEGVDFTTLLTLRDSGAIIGSSGLMGADPAVPSFETGYWAHTAYTGQGYVS